MKNIFKFSFLLITLISSHLFASYTVVEDQVGEAILSPTLQNIETKKIRLSNGLEALLVSDPEAVKSGAALSVGIGWNHEPYEHVGLAHFVEHMLFMGNEKYPVEKEYHDFIKARGGHTNAYTTSDKTVYTFEITNDHALEALDRFSAFFVSPLFNESGLARERQAVNEELLYRNNSDGIRAWMVQAKTLNPESNASVTRCGSLESLSNISRDELVSWYESNYSANVMKLVVYAPTPMDQLLLHVDAYFSPVKNKDVTPSRLAGPLVRPDCLGKTVYIEPLKDQKNLSIAWEVPEEFAHDLDYHTSGLIGNALGEESTHSLATKLKEEGLIVGLGCGLSKEDNHNASFVIEFELTDLGLEMRNLIIEQTYAAIHALQEKGIPRYRFDERVALAKLDYQFQSRPEAYDFVCDAAAGLLYEPLETYPKKSMWPTKYDSQKAQTFLSALEPTKARYFVMAPGHLVEQEFDQKEAFSDAKYTIQDTNSQLLNIWANIVLNDKFKIAAPNPYVPEDLKLVTTQKDFDDEGVPQVIHESKMSKVYYQADREFQVPEVSYSLFFQSPAQAPSIQSDVLSVLYQFSVQEKLLSHLEKGSLAGLSASINQNAKFGFLVKTSGYSEKAEAFLSTIIDEMQNHKPQKQDFERYKSFLARQYYNKSKAPPFQQSSETMKALILKDYNTPEVYYKALQQVDFEQFQEYCSSLFDSVYVRGMVYGNVTHASAKDFAKTVENSFSKSEVYPKENRYQMSVLDLASSDSPQYYSQSTDQMGSSTRLSVAFGQLEGAQRAAFEVLSRAISTPFFDTLRTKQQVGYIVGSGPRDHERECFMDFIAQSNSCSTRDMLARFELFNEEFLASIGTDELNQNQFDTIRCALVNEYMQPAVSVAEKGSELNALAYEYEDFDFKSKRIEALQNLTFDDFATFCYQNLGKENPHRIAVLINGDMSSSPTLDYMPIPNVSHFKAESQYLVKTPEVLLQVDNP